LRAVGGLTTAEIARAFLVPEATIAQRISRAKQRIKAEGASFRFPPDPERAERLSVVLQVLYLIFNEGYTTSSGAALQRTDLTSEAIRLTRAVHRLLPTDGEIAGLLALMVAPAIWRRAARLTRSRIEKSVPLTLSEIQADKDQLRAEAAFKKSVVEDAKTKTLHDIQDAETLARQEKTKRLKAMRLAKEAEDAAAGQTESRPDISTRIRVGAARSANTSPSVSAGAGASPLRFSSAAAGPPPQKFRRSSSSHTPQSAQFGTLVLSGATGGTGLDACGRVDGFSGFRWTERSAAVSLSTLFALSTSPGFTATCLEPRFLSPREAPSVRSRTEAPPLPRQAPT
jgi:hypothetical protein